MYPNLFNKDYNLIMHLMNHFCLQLLKTLPILSDIAFFSEFKMCFSNLTGRKSKTVQDPGLRFTLLDFLKFFSSTSEFSDAILDRFSIQRRTYQIVSFFELRFSNLTGNNSKTAYNSALRFTPFDFLMLFITIS